MNNNDGKMMSFVIDQETKRRLEEMAIAQGRSASNLIRWLINQEWDKHTRIEAYNVQQQPS